MPPRPDLLLLAKLAVLLGLCAVMAVSIAVPLREAIDLVTSNTLIGLFLYGMVCYACYALCCLPLQYAQHYGNFLRRGLAPEAAGWAKSYAADEGRKAVWFMLGLQVVYFFLQNTFWWWVWLGIVIVSLVALWQISYFWLIPLLFKWPEITDRELRKRVHELTERYKIKPEGMYQSILPAPDILRSGAILVRSGKRARVVVSATVAAFSPAEVEALLARDLGQHHYHGHTKRVLAQAAAAAAVCAAVGVSFEPLARRMCFSPITDISTVPLMVFLFVVYGVPLRVVVNAFLCGIEKGADRFALRLTHAPDALVSVFVRQAATRGVTVAPQFRLVQLWQSAAPRLEQRLNLAQDFADGLAARSRTR